MKNFIKASMIRAIKTMAQTAVSLIPVAANINEVDWVIILGTSTTAGILSVVTSIATGLPEVEEE